MMAQREMRKVKEESACVGHLHPLEAIPYYRQAVLSRLTAVTRLDYVSMVAHGGGFREQPSVPSRSFASASWLLAFSMISLVGLF